MASNVQQLPYKISHVCVTADHVNVFFVIYRGADKSLARPGRKQATATEDFDVHISCFGGKQWQTTPKNLPRMQRIRAIPVA